MRPWALAYLVFSLTVGPAFCQDVGDAVRGRAYAERMCSECHAVEKGEMDSFEIEATPLQSIANAPEMSEIALTSFFQTSHPSMPNLIVAGSDVRDLIAYIQSLKTKPR